MSADKKYTERDLVLAKREGFVAGEAYSHRRGQDPRETATRHYPLPKIVRPRVVADHWDTKWRSVGGVIEKIDYSGQFAPFITEHSTNTDFCVNLERVRIWADLLARPNEEIDDDGSSPLPGDRV